MQQHDHDIDLTRNTPFDMALRQKRFALVLCGDDVLATDLFKRLTMMGNTPSGSNISPAAFQFYQMKKLYELWMDDLKSTSQTPGIFQAGREKEAIEKGLDPSFAKAMGEMPSLHRALLLLIYGENFSYSATAQLLNISIEDLMGALAAARQKISMQSEPTERRPLANRADIREEVSHDAAQ